MSTEQQLDEMGSRIAARFALMLDDLPGEDPAHMPLHPPRRRYFEQILGVAPSPELIETVREILGSPDPEVPVEFVEELRRAGFEIRRVS